MTKKTLRIFLEEARADVKVLDRCRRHGMWDATFYKWKAMCASDMPG